MFPEIVQLASGELGQIGMDFGQHPIGTVAITAEAKFLKADQAVE